MDSLEQGLKSPAKKDVDPLIDTGSDTSKIGINYVYQVVSPL